MSYIYIYLRKEIFADYALLKPCSIQLFEHCELTLIGKGLVHKLGCKADQLKVQRGEHKSHHCMYSKSHTCITMKSSGHKIIICNVWKNGEALSESPAVHGSWNYSASWH